MSAPNELSFLPEDYLEQKYKRRANIVCGLLIALVLGGVGVGFRVKNAHHGKVQADFVDVDAKYIDAARKIEQVKKMHEQQREVVHHAELAASLVERVPRSNILAELTNALPTGVSLLDLAMRSTTHVSAAAPTPTSSFDQHRLAIEQQNANALGLASQPPQYDIHLTITGVAQNDVQVAQLISRLNHNNLFKDVNLVISDTYAEQRSNTKGDKTETLRRWQIELMVNPLADVRENTKTAAVEISK